MTGWDTRADIGLLSASASTSVNPTHGVAGHYGGAGPFKRRSHSGCREIWRAWQRFHLDDGTNNYVDIAYNLGVCHHDVVLEGRSTRQRPKVRGGANGNYTVNTNRYSVVAVWGAEDGEWPESLRRAWRYARDWLRYQDSRTGSGITPHSDLSSTSCPGHHGRSWLNEGAPIEEEDMPLSNEDLERVVNAISGREWDSFTEGEGKTTMVEQIFRARRDAAKALELVETLTRTYPDFVDDGDSTLIQQAFRARRDAHRAAEG